MVKTSSSDSNGVKKGAWSEEEDQKLRAYIQRYGHWNWGLLPQFAGLSRSGKSCRLRWMNYLRPNIKHGKFTKEEDDMIIHLHNKLGNKWSTIATELRERSDNEIKNRWNTYLKKRARDDHMVLETDHHGTMQTTDQDQANYKEYQEPHLQNEGDMNLAGIISLDSPSYSKQTAISSCWLSSSDSGVTSNVASQTSEDFWTETFLEDITSSVDSMCASSNVFDESVTLSSYADMMINDPFSWSMLESYYEYNNEFSWDCI